MTLLLKNFFNKNFSLLIFKIFLGATFLNFYNYNNTIEIKYFEFVFYFLLIIFISFLFFQFFLLKHIKKDFSYGIFFLAILTLDKNIFHLVTVKWFYLLFIFLFIFICQKFKIFSLLIKNFVIIFVILNFCINITFLVFNNNYNLNNFNLKDYSIPKDKLKFSSIFKNNFYVIVLDQHPSPEAITNAFPKNIFFLKFLKDKKFALKSIENDAYKASHTLYSMANILNPYIDSYENFVLSDIKKVVKGENYLRDITRFNGSKFLFLNGSAYDELLSCDKKLVDQCFEPNIEGGEKKMKLNMLESFLNGSILQKKFFLQKIMKFFIYLNNFFYKQQEIFVNKDKQKEMKEESWKFFRGLVSELTPKIKKLDDYSPFTLYAHFLNPHPPYSRDENCSQHKNIKDEIPINLLYFEKFMICTDKMTIDLINEIEDINQQKKYSILIISDNDRADSLKKNLYSDPNILNKNFFAFFSNFAFKLNNDCKNYLKDIKNTSDIFKSLSKC